MSTMKRMTSDYRHPKHREIAHLIRQGATNRDVARELIVDHRAVARVRTMLGIPPKNNATSAEDKLNKYSSPPDQAGHVVWLGRTGPWGTPVIRHRRTDLSAAAVAFERRTGRPPVGVCRSDCGMKQCVADAHVLDDLERRRIRMQERALHGLAPQLWDVCPNGHGWDEHGRVESDLTPYCKACHADRYALWRASRADES